MSNYTFEDYRKAIKAKYQEEIEGEYSNNLSSPTAANLRNLCIKRFMSDSNREDLITFESFFDFPFDKDKKNLFGEDELNKLEAVKRFFLGKTEKPAEDTIQLAAILVDLQPRPFSNFRKQIDEEDLELINELRNNNNSESEVSVIESLEKKEEESFTVSNEDFVDTESETLPKKIFLNQPSVLKQSLVDIVDKSKSKKIKYFSIGAGLIFLIIMLFLVFPEKECMQWSNDHYELVHCDEPIHGNLNDVIPKDENLLKFRKVIVCDTTTCFKPDGKAIIWYAKTANGIDFFNNHGYHPENHSSLKAVTNYILDKYVYGKGVKCDK